MLPPKVVQSARQPCSVPLIVAEPALTLLRTIQLLWPAPKMYDVVSPEPMLY